MMCFYKYRKLYHEKCVECDNLKDIITDLKIEIRDMDDELNEYKNLYEIEADEHAETKAKLEEAIEEINKVREWLIKVREVFTNEEKSSS